MAVIAQVRIDGTKHQLSGAALGLLEKLLDGDLRVAFARRIKCVNYYKDENGTEHRIPHRCVMSLVERGFVEISDTILPILNTRLRIAITDSGRVVAEQALKKFKVQEGIILHRDPIADIPGDQNE